jgi:DNA-binding GntR family transcriptional regulator
MNTVKAIQRLPAVTRRSQVVDALRDAILSGELPPGTKITELDLAARFHVSRGPIREGIRELIDEGLLVSQPYTGTYVTVVDEKAINDAYGLRRVLEKYAYTLVWARRDTEFKMSLMHRYEALLAIASQGNLSAEMTAEMNFHGLAAECSGNDLLLSTWRHVASRFRVGFILHRATPANPDSASMHQRFLAVALGDDLDLMLAEVDNHIDHGLQMTQMMLSSMRQDGLAAEPPRRRQRP